MGQFHLDPNAYLALMRAGVPCYDDLQDEVAAATLGVDVARVLELGTGTGETSRRVLAAHPRARLTGIDGSPGMIEMAGRNLDPDRVDRLVLSRMEDPLPHGPFDLVVSALCVHHLDGAGKADLFRRIASVLRAGGRFVLGDVIVPDRPEDRVTPIEPGVDLPDRVEDLLRWLDDAGFDVAITWLRQDMAVLRADRA